MPYDACCGRYISGDANAPTAEALMRSRYTAYVIGDGDYIATTWAEETRPSDLNVEGEGFQRLVILEVTGGGLFDSSGEVEFQAHYPGSVLRERSQFVRRGGTWVYVEGTIR